MEDDSDYSRYFAYMNLFVFAMLILVMADNMLFLYLGWEGVGLCSYLLVGFWYKDPGQRPRSPQGVCLSHALAILPWPWACSCCLPNSGRSKYSR